MSGNGFSHQPQQVEPVKTKFRTIQTQIPVPESISLLKEVYQHESHSMHGQMPIIWDRAEGFQVYDSWGNCWLDFSSTIFVTNAGHGNPKIVRALKDVLAKPLLHTYTYTSPERADYLRYLVNNTPAQFEKAFLLSAGTEATEAALKLMRLNGQKKGKRRGGILCFEGNWHGRTLGAQMMSWDSRQKEWIGYHDPNIHHIPFPYPWRKDAVARPTKYFRENLEKFLSEKQLDAEKDICGVMMETFQGWGAIFYPEEFVQEVRKFTEECGALLAFDEMQAGFGRTGKLFGYQHYGIEADLLCCGKGASSSLPLALVLGNKELMDLPGVGSMSSTHSANPMACAAGRANLEVILEDGLLENSRQLGKLFHQRLALIQQKYPEHLAYIEGRGLLAGILFMDSTGKPLSSLCDRISELCLQRGLLVVHTGRESIKLAPPLMIHEEALLEGVDVFESAIKSAIEEI
jgi:4-aminobutyrate aminotransferase-like enzyme